MTWVIIFWTSFVWASDPLNSGIAIDNINIDLPIVKPPTVDISNSNKIENIDSEQKKEPQVGESNNEGKGPAQEAGKRGDQDSSSAYMQTKESNEEEEDQESEEDLDEADDSQKKTSPP